MTAVLPTQVGVFRRDRLVDGPYSTPAGTTKNKADPDDLPVRRRVRLHDQVTGQPLRELWSDTSTGAYQFHGIRAGLFFVMATDHTGQYNGVITTDIVVPEPAP